MGRSLWLDAVAELLQGPAAFYRGSAKLHGRQAHRGRDVCNVPPAQPGLPPWGRQTRRFIAITTLMTSPSTDLLTWKSAAHLASFDTMATVLNSPSSMRLPMRPATQDRTLPLSAARGVWAQSLLFWPFHPTLPDFQPLRGGLVHSICFSGKSREIIHLDARSGDAEFLEHLLEPNDHCPWA
jgi:hypothetical protein